jgi:hypothetical protein
LFKTQGTRFVHGEHLPLPSLLFSFFITIILLITTIIQSIWSVHIQDPGREDSLRRTAPASVQSVLPALTRPLSSVPAPGLAGPVVFILGPDPLLMSIQLLGQDPFSRSCSVFSES